MNKAKVFIDTLGCPKNFNDSECAAAVLEHGGYCLVGAPEDADYIIVNTCAFIEEAKRESIERIFDMAKMRKPAAKLIVSGCLAQRYAKELFAEMPEADAFIGVNDYAKLPEILAGLAGGRRLISCGGCDSEYLRRTLRKYADDPYTATIKIAEGCDNCCSYCVIPAIRGRYRSKRMEDVIAEAEELASLGCRELILIAQDVTFYGRDLYGKYMLPELLTRLCRVGGIRWIRLMYCYDSRITEELIAVMAREEKICHYIDIPIQHISDRVLREMRRQSDSAGIRKVLSGLRAAMPDIAIRTTLLVGFPGETDDDFARLMDFVREEKFERLGVFAYSREEGTEAGERADQILPETAAERRDAIMELQNGISLEHNRSLKGKLLEVIVDGREDDGSYVGRSRFDAPEIDGGVLFASDRELRPGDIVKVRIEDAFDYDLTGTEEA